MRKLFKAIFIVLLIFLVGAAFYTGIKKYQEIERKYNEMKGKQAKIESLLGQPIEKALQLKEQYSRKCTIFFTNEAREDQIFELKKNILDKHISNSVTYVSESEALSIFTKMNPDIDNSLIGEGVLPASLEFKVKDTQSLISYLETIKDTVSIDQVLCGGVSILKNDLSPTPIPTLSRENLLTYNGDGYIFTYPVDYEIKSISSDSAEIDLRFYATDKEAFWLREISHEKSVGINTKNLMVLYQQPQAAQELNTTDITLHNNTFVKMSYAICQLPECAIIIGKNYGYGLSLKDKTILLYNSSMPESEFEKIILESLTLL